MSCRRRRGYRRFSTSAYRLLGDFEVAINGGVWVATGGIKKMTGFVLVIFSCKTELDLLADRLIYFSL